MPTVLRGFLLAGALLMAAAGSALAAPAITEYVLPSNYKQAVALATGPNGDLWFTQTNLGVVGETTPAGAMSEVSGLSHAGAGISEGPDGNMWVVEPGGPAIARITPSGTVTEFPLANGAQPEDIVAGPDGNLWFTEEGNNGAIGRITPSGTVHLFTAGLTSNSVPDQIVLGPDGNLWFTEANNGAIGRITPSGVISEFSLPVVGGPGTYKPQDIVAGADGNLWFTEQGSNGAIGRITRTGLVTQFTTTTLGLPTSTTVAGIAAGPDGNLWFTEQGGSGLASIATMTTSGSVLQTINTPTQNSQPAAITVGPDGRLWFAEENNSGAVGVVDETFTTSSGTGTPNTPAVETSAATNVDQTTATLNGLVDPSGSPVTFHFDWGTTTAYGLLSPTPDALVGAGYQLLGVSQKLAGLTPGTVYHYRLVASNCSGCQPGTSTGSDLTFTTLPVTAPELGSTAQATAQSGTVQVTGPGSKTSQPLGTSQDIKVGSLVDTTHGVVRLIVAVNRNGKTKAATVWGGKFRVEQNRKTALTTFALVGALSCRAKSRHSLVAARASKGKGKGNPSRSLWAKDNHGKFATRGNNSVATVRGTFWRTVDTCAGTRTIVKLGLVSVHNLRNHKTVLVRAGHSYLARA